MTTSASQLARELEGAAERVQIIAPAELQVMLRRAALRIRNAEGLSLAPDADKAVNAIAHATGLARNELLRRIICEWLETGGYLPAHDLGEDSKTDGNC